MYNLVSGLFTHVLNFVYTYTTRVSVCVYVCARVGRWCVFVCVCVCERERERETETETETERQRDRERA